MAEIHNRRIISLKEQQKTKEIPLYISRSEISTEGNRTGFWRFVRPGYDEKTAPCSRACPAGEDIARIEMLAGRGMYMAAWETILRENPFPAVCGRVCFHPCERACNRQELDGAVSVNRLERFIGDMAIAEAYALPHPFYGDDRESDRRSAVGKRIAIAGSGPAGLSAAYFLTRLGHQCFVFEAEKEPGGVLRWGIPRYRLPEDILKTEISRILDMGVEIFCGQPLTQDFTDRGKGDFDAVFLACGYGQSLSLHIPGEEYAQDGLQFLHSVRSGKETEIQGTALVIGGGNTAIDVARTLIRLGAEVKILYRRRRQDMPAFAHEVGMAAEEGLEIMELLSPLRIQADKEGYVTEVQKMKVSDMQGRDGRCRSVPDEGKRQNLRASHIFTAIGAEAEQPWFLPPKGTGDILELPFCTFRKGERPLLYGGDLTTTVKSAADAIASGKAAAMALDTCFREGYEAIAEKLEQCRIGDGNSLSMEIYLSGERGKRSGQTVSFGEINTDYFSGMQRRQPRILSPEDRAGDFSETEKSFDRETALAEASRCFNCGICNDCDNCRLFCPEVAIFIDGTRCINYDYCKGCGICVEECPRNAMSLEEEKI